MTSQNKTVITFGVFDMLHIGHILLFMRAKEYGDRLVVAIQDSDYVLKYKPNTRIIYTTEERLFMVNSIRYVDSVITYKDVDKDIQNTPFDILILGQDQNHSGFKSAIEWCNQHGKEVVRLPRTEGISSTLLREYSRTK